MICPEGHDSAAVDYCDVCGSPMHLSATPAPPSSMPMGQTEQGPAPVPEPAESEPGPSTQDCPNCQAVNHADALFCEACGYDFTTGAAPFAIDGSNAAPHETRSGAEPEPEPEPEPAVTTTAEPEGGPDRTLPADAGPTATPDPEPDPAPEPAQAPAPPSEPGPAPTPAPVRQVPATAYPVPTDEPWEHAGAWAVEIWVDPDWHQVQSSPEECPSPGVPDVVLAQRPALLVGRRSSSQRVRPDVDCGADTGVSRRHAQLTSDGTRWWVEDLGSSNGTFEGETGGPLPEQPLEPGRRTEITPDDRVYLGAWTRLVVRRSTASERAGQG